MEKTTSQVPIDMVTPNELPRESPIKFDEVCRIIGELYFRVHHQESTQAEQFKAVVGQLQERIQGYIEENNRLKAELSRHEREAESRSAKPDNSGKGKN